MALRFRGLDAPIEVQYWKGGSAPTPDPAVQTNAEAAANRYNIVGPGGKQTWTSGGREVIGYDSAGNPQYGQQSTQTVDLNPSEQRQYDTRNQIAEQLLTGNQKNISDLTEDPFSYDRSNLPSGSYTTDRSGYDSTPYSTDRSGYDTGAFSYDQATPAAAKAVYERQSALLQPDFDRQNRSFEQQMANAGIPVGSEAYNDALDQQKKSQNFALADAARAATTTGAQMALSERQQRTGEADTRAGQALTQRQQRETEAGTRASQGLTQRQQQGAEASQRAGLDLSERQQRYNEIAAALGSSQLQPVGAYGQQSSPIDVAGAYQNANNANLAKYNAGVSGNNAMIGGLGQLGSAVIGNWGSIFSDERLKDDVDQVGELPSGEGVYEYRYKGEDDDTPKHTGVMAQEIEDNYPGAVHTDPRSGFKKVNYRRLISEALAA